MARLLETGSGLVISYPSWLALLAVAGVALIGYAARPKAAVKKRWALLAVAGILLYSGIYFFTYRVTLTPESGRVYGFLREDTRMAWSDAKSADVVLRPGGRGGPKEFLVVVDSANRELESPLAPLDGGERERVVAFVAARMRR